MGGEATRLAAGASLKALLSASNCFTISVSSERDFFRFIHFVRIKGSSSVVRCLRKINIINLDPNNYL
jgi:hypothetical protein